jgi:hypothetical protein
MLRIILAAALVTCAYGHSYEAAQTDWSGGGGVPGPVTDWGDTFDGATNVDWSGTPGELVLGPGLTEKIITDATDNAPMLCTADIDSDDDLDVVAAVGTTAKWWENVDGYGSSWIEHVISELGMPAHSVNTADFDGDGDLDALYTAGAFVASGWWFENTDGSGTSWTKRSRFRDAQYLRTADMDKDNDVDAVGSTYDSKSLVYWENADGTGLAWNQYTIDDAFEGSMSVYVADVDSDDNLDVVAATLVGNEVAWWRNDGSSPPVWTKRSVDSSFTNARAVFAADVDGDEDVDIVGGALVGSELAWWENADGTGTSWKKGTISEGAEVNSVCAGDMDGDGDTDVLAAFNSANNIVLYENVNGAGTVWAPRTIGEGAIGGSCVDVADLDGDGHPDVVGSLNGEPGSAALHWWDVSGYRGSGELVSSVLDTGGPADWGQIDWTAEAPADTTVKFRVRSSSNGGDMGDWSPEITSPGVLGSYLTNGDRYVQYKAELETADRDFTPTLEDVTIDWGYTGIALTSFSAESTRKGIRVCWECGAGVAGFNLYRSARPKSERAITSRDKLNAELITGESPYEYLDTGVEKEVTYNYWLEALDVGGTSETFGPVECTWRGALPTAYALYQSRPNPAPGTATIAFDLPETASVTLTVYDLSGRKVTTVVNETLAAGEHEAEVSGLAPGVYVYRLYAGDFTASKKMVIVR